MIGVVPAGCGKCLPCRIMRRRVWAHRILLESYKHGDSCFATLTYDEDHVPADGSLAPPVVQLWLKRLRKKLSPEKIRFFLVGEYGDESFRPHYHAALFGVSALVAGGVDGDAGIVRETWPYGFTFVGELNEATSKYVAGYTVKKMTSKEDSRLEGRFPEFARMSLRPGIGAGAMEDVGRCLGTQERAFRSSGTSDVPYTLRHGKRDVALGRYLRRKLRGHLGFGSEDVPEQAQKDYAEEMRRVCEEAVRVEENASKSIGKIMVDDNKQKRLNQAARFKIFESRRNI